MKQHFIRDKKFHSRRAGPYRTEIQESFKTVFLQNNEENLKNKSNNLLQRKTPQVASVVEFRAP